MNIRTRPGASMPTTAFFVLEPLACIPSLFFGIIKRKLRRLAKSRIVFVQLCFEIVPIAAHPHGGDHRSKVLPQLRIAGVASKPLEILAQSGHWSLLPNASGPFWD